MYHLSRNKMLQLVKGETIDFNRGSANRSLNSILAILKQISGTEKLIEALTSFKLPHNLE